MIVARGLGRRGTPIVASGLGRVPAAVVQAAVEVYSGGWPEPPDRDEVRRQRERMGIIPPAPKSPQIAPQRPSEAPPAAPYEWREPGFDWAAAEDLPRLARTLDQLADEARFADLVAAERIAAAVQAAEARQAALLREEADLVHVLGALLAGQGALVDRQVAALQTPGQGEEADLAFIIAALAAIA